MRSQLTLVVLLLLSACHKNDEPAIDNTGELPSYVKAFTTDAQKRNATLTKTDITIQFVDAATIAPDDVTFAANTGEINISREAWQKFTEAQKEILVYNTLARVMMDQTPTDEMLPNCTDYKSMLNDDANFVAYDALDSERRPYYIDELFDPSTAYPSWGGTIGTNKTNILYESNSWTFYAVNGTTNTGSVAEDGSLNIHGVSNNQGRGYWILKVPSNRVAAGSTVILSFKMKTSAITGNSPVATIQAKQDPAFTGSTYQKVHGTIDWTDMQLIMNCYPAQSDLLIYLSLDGSTSGDVWFDDIVIDYYN